jgi:hypothetical protein
VAQDNVNGPRPTAFVLAGRHGHGGGRRAGPSTARGILALGGPAATSTSARTSPPCARPGESFGHVRGAFTGTDTAKRGLLVAADGGTLFLDEIDDA